MTTRSIASARAHAAASVAWVPWSTDAFARASRETKPVLLSITAAWCHACQEMDVTTYASEEVVALIRDRFVPVRVDADRRPDINDRYNLGGWPTTAFLTPDGELLGGGTFVTPERMPRVLAQVADALGTRGAEIAAARTARDGDAAAALSRDPSDSAPQHPPTHPPTPTPTPTLTHPLTHTIVDVVFATFDEQAGGFGVAPKFPLTAPLHLALALYRETNDPRWRSIVERTLDGMSGGALRDAADGGFYRYATARDWGNPHPEKLLETNASLLRIYADAAVQLRDDRYLETAAGLAIFINERLTSEAGYRGSEAESTVYTDSSAAASAALLAASPALGDTSLGQDALQSLERVLLACYRPGSGVAHYVDGEPRVPGLLADQVAAMHALLDAQEAAGGEPYGMMAEELAHYMLRVLWDEENGGFRDRTHEQDEVGLMRSRRKPLVSNCEAARGLARLARSSANPEFRTHAEATLRSVSRDALHQGPLAAHCVLARNELGP